eukprot:173027-Prymnesium_polylepis.1
MEAARGPIAVGREVSHVRRRTGVQLAVAWQYALCTSQSRCAVILDHGCGCAARHAGEAATCGSSALRSIHSRPPRTAAATQHVEDPPPAAGTGPPSSKPTCRGPAAAPQREARRQEPRASSLEQNFEPS